MDNKQQIELALRQIKLNLARLYLAAGINADGTCKPDKLINNYADIHDEGHELVMELFHYLQLEEGS